VRKIKINKNKVKEYPTFTVGYGRENFAIKYPVNPREGVCDACGKSIAEHQITVTQLHHWIYQYKTAAIKKDPYKVLDNLVEFCFGCHKIGDSLREILYLKKERLITVIQVGLLMPTEMKEKLDWVAKAWLVARKTDKKKVRLEEFTEDG
jgi:hypothetical protein